MAVRSLRGRFPAARRRAHVALAARRKGTNCRLRRWEGYVPGQTLDIDYRYAEGDNERLPPLARELITLAPGVIFAGEPSAARAV
jgi:hypothetical protein